MLTLDLSGFPLKFTVNWKPKEFQISPISTNSDVTSFIPDNFPDRSTIMTDKKQCFQRSNISEMLRPIRLKLQNMFSFYLTNTLDSK